MRRARHGAHASRVLQRGSTEMPTVAMSPSSLAHSCDLAYLMDMNRGAVNVNARAACGATRRVPATLHCVHAGRRTQPHARATRPRPHAPAVEPPRTTRVQRCPRHAEPISLPCTRCRIQAPPPPAGPGASRLRLSPRGAAAGPRCLRRGRHRELARRASDREPRDSPPARPDLAAETTEGRARRSIVSRLGRRGGRPWYIEQDVPRGGVRRETCCTFAAAQRKDKRGEGGRCETNAWRLRCCPGCC